MKLYFTLYYNIFASHFVRLYLTYLLSLLIQNRIMSRLEKLGQNIKKYRKIKKLSQNELAELINFSREHLACIETGKEYISLRKLFLIADKLEVSLTNLINFD